MKLEIDRGSVSVRFAVVIGLIVGLMIPLLLVSGVVADREHYYRTALSSVARSWASQQRVVGPLIVIPLAAPDDSWVTDGTPAAGQYVVVMPEELELTVDSRHEMRNLGIFETPVFEADITATGTFGALDVAQLESRFGRLDLDQASILIGISDTRGIRDATLQWDNEAIGLTAGTSHTFMGDGTMGDGIHAALPASRAAIAPANFELSLSLRGTQRFSTVPIGRRSTVSITSTWPHPSFDGRFLPDLRDVTKDGFTASWTTHELARGFPTISQLDASAHLFEGKAVGFRLFEPVTPYRSVARGVKYGVLFIALTLVTVLCIELTIGIRFHYVQYGVVGIALVLFYLAWLSLAEHIGFAAGYTVAAVVLTAMISWYTLAMTERRRLAATTAAVLAALYLVLYVLLRLESLSLLVGTAVLLAMLAMLMRATRGLTTTPAI